MKKLILFEHVTLDGFVAGSNGDMSWIRVDEALFEFASKQTAEADTALYGRVTWEMMEAYWPTAAQRPNASRHDVVHSNWYNSVDKIVLSQSRQGKEEGRTRFIGSNAIDYIGALKRRSGKNILMFGSPSAAHSLMEAGLVDEFWLFINPVTIGAGIRLFPAVQQQFDLVNLSRFDSGVAGMHYRKH